MAKTVVIMTISDLAKDSRTYKQAFSLARQGYQCTVLQGESGNLDAAALPFKLRTVGRPYAGKKEKACVCAASAAPAAGECKVRWKDYLPEKVRGAAPYGRYLYRQLRFQWGLRRQIPEADLYAIHYFDLFPAVQALAKRQGSAILYDAHDFHSGLKPLETLSRFERHYVKPWQKRLEAHCVQESHAVVTVCEGLATLIRDTFGRQPSVIRNCHDVRLDRTHTRSLRQTLGLTATDRLLVTLGDAKPCMALLQAFQALENLPENVHLAFLGDGYAPYLTGAAYQAVRHRVHAPGRARLDEIVPLVRDADAALILYYSHSANSAHCLPNGFFQAIAAGLPLLYPALPELSRIASQDGLGIAIDPLNASSIQEGVKQLFDEPARLETYQSHCRRVSALLSWEKEEEQFLQLVESTLNARKR